MTAKINHKNYFPLIIGGILFFAIYLIGIKVPQETIREIVKNAGAFGIVIFIFLIWLTNIIAPLSASPFLFAGFYLFGQTVVIYAFIAALFASISNFWIAKIYGRFLVKKLVGEDGLEKIDKFIKNYGYQTLFISRVFLSQFHDVVSYAFGLTEMRFRIYIITSTLGLIPGTIILYLISSKIHNALLFTILNLAIAYISLSIYIVLRKIINKRK